MSTKSISHMRRMARQQLESLHRAGLKHLHRSTVGPIESSAADSVSEEAHRGVNRAASTTAGKPNEQPIAATCEVVTADQPVPTNSYPSLFEDTEPQSEPRLIQDSNKLPQRKTTRSERETRLAELAKCVAGCTRCTELAATRTQTVFGVGNPEAKIMFVGEAPGADEDRQGEPFVGRAGKLLNDIIAACRLKREEIYICNILRCRPPQNRTPTAEEAANCREYLDGQIETIDPDYIVCWGSVAAQNLLDTKFSMGKLRGRFLSYRGAKVLCTYHPAYLLRNPPAKKDVWEDMKFLMLDMGVDLSKT